MYIYITKNLRKRVALFLLLHLALVVVMLSNSWAESTATQALRGSDRLDVVTSLHFIGNTEHLLSTDMGGSLHLWNIDSGVLVKSVTFLQKFEMLDQTRETSEPLTSLDVSRDEGIAALGSRDRTVRVWDLKEWTQLKVFTGNEFGVRVVRLDPHSKYLASGGHDGTIRVWDMGESGEARILAGHMGTVTSLVFSLDGENLISAGEDGYLKVWEISSGKLMDSRNLDSGPVSCISISPDGKLLAIGFDEVGHIDIWDWPQRRVITRLIGHSLGVLDVVFSNAGKMLVSGSQDSTAKIWSIESGKALHTLSPHADSVRAVALVGGGELVVTGSGLSINLWNVSDGKLRRMISGKLR